MPTESENEDIDPYVLRSKKLTPSADYPQSTDREYSEWRSTIVSDAQKLVASIPEWTPKGKFQNDLVQVYMKKDGQDSQPWYARRSIHKDISYETFKKGLLENHSVNEKEYIGNIKTAKKLSTVIDDEIEVWQMNYKLPFPVRDRYFVFVILCIEESENSFLVISLPLRSHPMEDREEHDKRAFYESIEHVQRHNSRIEWRMCTRSDPSGMIPDFVTNMSLPKAISEDVPKFIQWAQKRFDTRTSSRHSADTSSMKRTHS